jgi:hypothetical protein
MLNEKPWNIAIWIAGSGMLFGLYTYDLSQTMPGFYVDESGLAYNAFLVSRTGAGEFGRAFPLYFQFYTYSFIQFCSPTQIYLLAALFLIVPPSILATRIFSAFWVFTACLLLGLLGKRTSGSSTAGLIVGGTALLTPWFFDVRGLLLEPHMVPLAVVLFLHSLYNAYTKERWGWLNSLAITGSLALLTYCYTSGRLLGLLFAAGLISFATSRERIWSVAKTWLLYGFTLLPLVVFNLKNPGVLTARLYEVSYIRPGMPWSEIVTLFPARFLQDINPAAMLLYGDHHARHHVQGSGGAILMATFVIAVLGLLIVLVRHLRDPWWRFVIYGLFAAIVPGALANEPFHQMRLMAFPVFLLMLTVPALEWFFDLRRTLGRGSDESDEGRRTHSFFGKFVIPWGAKTAILILLLMLTVGQAVYYQRVVRAEGPKRFFDFDYSYKAAYDEAVSQPQRPVYLEDGFWGPRYVTAFWYASVEGRPTSEFVHLSPGQKPPSGSIVISAEQNCRDCDILKRSGEYILYKVK